MSGVQGCLILEFPLNCCNSEKVLTPAQAGIQFVDISGVLVTPDQESGTCSYPPSMSYGASDHLGAIAFRNKTG